MPCDLRTSRHESTPAANIMSYAFVARKLGDCDRSGKLLSGIRAQTDYIRTHDASLFFIRGLHLANLMPWTWRELPSSNRCFATAVLSNIADPTRLFTASFPRRNGRLVAGNLALESIVAWSPLRPMTHTGIVVSTYANRLSLGLNCPAHVLSRDDASRLLDSYVAHLQTTAVMK